MADYIFKHVKAHLGYSGEDRLMKTSDDMKKLLRSGRTLKVIKPGQTPTPRTLKNREKNPLKKKNSSETREIIDVKFSHGRITWKTSSTCQFENCWKTSKLDGSCADHSSSYSTHFLIKDDNNPIVTTFLLSTPVHVQNTKYKLNDFIEVVRNDKRHYASFQKYKERRLQEKLPPRWTLLTPKPWVAKNLDSSRIFHQTIAITLCIITMMNANEGNQKQRLQFIRDQVYIDKVDWEAVKKILESSGFSISLGEPSDLGELKESPLLKIADLSWREGDEWIYMKFGTIRKIYVGTSKQDHSRGPMPESYIPKRHLIVDPLAKGISIFQCEDEDQTILNSETSKMEGIGQMGVLFCKMLGGEIDDHLIQPDFSKYENFSDWEDRHMERMKMFFAFWSSRELEFTPPATLDIKSINWGPATKHLQINSNWNSCHCLNFFPCIIAILK